MDPQQKPDGSKQLTAIYIGGKHTVLQLEPSARKPAILHSRRKINATSAHSFSESVEGVGASFALAFV